ncbi:MAG: hypothetical protein ACTHJR_11130 [Sphingomonas sp.]|uniref:hypothetical protein n=1 Tax=Sphingomonas sp. TaxID=28214 RepID=UPI003F806029
MTDENIYAVRATHDAYYNWWFLENLVIGANGEPMWRRRRPQLSIGVPPRAEVERDETQAKKLARKLTRDLGQNLDIAVLGEHGQNSTLLKLSKAYLASRRREDEEAMMFIEGQKRHAGTITPPRSAIVAPSDADADDIHRALQELPYLRTVVVGHGVTRALAHSADGLTWRRLSNGYISRKGATWGHRARIADAFGLHPAEHWGRTKAAIRKILLPRAIDMLQLQPMKEMLAEALAAGRHAVVLDRFVFWYEPDGDIGWTVKEIGAHDAKHADAVEWAAGTIISKNFGRIVVLPFIKDDGTHVAGHTRNAPGDGPAKPRKPGESKHIAFTRLQGDAMLGLLGELPYGP